MNLKALIIVGLLIVVTALHYGVAPSHPALHLLHRELAATLEIMNRLSSAATV